MQEKTTKYIEAIARHVISPLKNSAVSEHCFASAILIFGAIDGLGNLIHPDENANSGTRFKYFLPRLGQKYAVSRELIWKLRNSIAHNAINVAAFMSQAEDTEFHHLEVDCGHIFVHTRQLANDFCHAFEELLAELQQDCELSNRVESRLEYAELSEPFWRIMDVKSTEPPRVKFVQAR